MSTAPLGSLPRARRPAAGLPEGKWNVEARDRLNEKARDYEVVAASEVERAPLGKTDEHVAAATAFAAVALALREVADALGEAA